jgi:hypothetical protein
MNWSGYAVHRGGLRFRSVTGVWRQPATSCTPGMRTFSAVWVGLGGFAIDSQALEQIGTEADCTSTGRMRLSAWYELVPEPTRPVAMTIRAGDLMRAQVTVVGSRVSLGLVDETGHRSFSRTSTAQAVDVSSAEWIVEAPSACLFDGRCFGLPLANFGSVRFSRVSAADTSGLSGPISSPLWGNTGITLNSSPHRLASDAIIATATPSPLQGAGTAFTVVYAQQAAQAPPPPVLSAVADAPASGVSSLPRRA